MCLTFIYQSHSFPSHLNILLEHRDQKMSSMLITYNFQKQMVKINAK